ncbi:MAG: metallophosphoesterase [Halobacteriota archaeon]
MEALVTADTHWDEPTDSLDGYVGSADVVVHAGDFVSRGALEHLRTMSDELHAVRGNADVPAVEAELPARRRLEVGGVSLGVVHGHLRNGDSLVYLGLELDVDLLVHGHTHRPRYREGDVDVLSPGSPTRPRGSPPSVARLRFSDGGYDGEFVDVSRDAAFGSFGPGGGT